MQGIKIQEPSLVVSPDETQRHDLPYKGLSPSWLERIAPHYRWFCLANSWRILRAAIDSFRGHIRLQSPKQLSSVGLGPAFESSPLQSGRTNTRSVARAFYTKMLLAKWGWADTVDLRIFLMGFDAGEQWTRYTEGNGEQTPTSPSSWLYSFEQEFGSVPDRIKQAISQETKPQV